MIAYVKLSPPMVKSRLFILVSSIMFFGFLLSRALVLCTSSPPSVLEPTPCRGQDVDCESDPIASPQEPLPLYDNLLSHTAHRH